MKIFDARFVFVAALVSFALGACQQGSSPYSTGEVTSSPPTSTGGGLNLLQLTDVVIDSSYQLPLANGVLSVAPSGAWAAVSDAEGARLFVVAFETREVRSVPLAVDDRPGRVLATENSIWVQLRQSNALVLVDAVSGSISKRFSPCRGPQGWALDGERVHVACRDGALVTLDVNTAEEIRRVQLEDDLRDVVTRGPGLVVSRFRSAELLFVDAEGRFEKKLALAPGDGVVPAVAWRLRALEDGRLLVAHQMHTGPQLPGFMAYRGEGCGSRATPALSLVDPDGIGPAFEPAQPTELLNRQRVDADKTTARWGLPFATGTLDFAVRGTDVLVSAPANALPLGVTLSSSIALFRINVSPFGTLPGCASSPGETGITVPVATELHAATGQWLVVDRSPAQLRFVDGSVFPLHGDSRLSTGLRLFQTNSGAGLACASCHPEGREDGYGWANVEGVRLTQTLEGGAATAPFHWDGALGDLETFVQEVFVTRMGFSQLVPVEALPPLERFLRDIPAQRADAPPIDDQVAEQLRRGEELFTDEAMGCDSCHRGGGSDEIQHDVGTSGSFFTPSLVDLALRGPYLHDACASELEDVFGPCGGEDEHARFRELTDAERVDLLAYLRSL